MGLAHPDKMKIAETDESADWFKEDNTSQLAVESSIKYANTASPTEKINLLLMSLMQIKILWSNSEIRCALLLGSARTLKA